MSSYEKRALREEVLDKEMEDEQRRKQCARNLVENFILQCSRSGMRVEDFIDACDYAKSIVGRQEMSEGTFRTYFERMKFLE